MATEAEIDAFHKAFKTVAGTMWTHIGHEMVQIHKEDSVIRSGDIEQSIRAYDWMEQLKKQPLVPESLQKEIVWYPTAERELILQRLYDQRKAMMKWLTDRITVPVEQLKKEIAKQNRK